MATIQDDRSPPKRRPGPKPRGRTVSPRRSLHALGKPKVVDGAGTFLGTVGGVEFDPASGEIAQLAAHKGSMLGMGGTTPIDAREIVSVGPELLTVNTAPRSSPPRRSDRYGPGRATPSFPEAGGYSTGRGAWPPTLGPKIDGRDRQR